MDAYTLEKIKNRWSYDDRFIEWLKKNSINFTGVSKMAKEIGMSANALSSILDKNNISLNYSYTKTDPRFKALYQDYDWCYQKFIVEGLSHDEMAIEANCTKRVIEKWCCEKHKLTQGHRKETVELNHMQHDLIIGSLLGDGHIDKRETQPLFIVSHAENQKDYLYWKYDILKNLCNQPPSVINKKLAYFKSTNSTHQCQNTYRISTRIHDCFIKYREYDIINTINLLNELSLSVYVLDDGYRSESNWSICVARYSENEKNHFISFLKNKFNLDAYILTDNRYIGFRAESSRELDVIILRNIPNDLDIIKYKILENNKIRKPQKRIYISVNNEKVLLREFCNKHNLNYKKAWRQITKKNMKPEDLII